MIYHINPENGNASRCRAAKGKCPFGNEDVHFTSKEAAARYYEQNQATFGPQPLPNLSTLYKEAPKAPIGLTKQYANLNGIQTDLDANLIDMDEARRRIGYASKQIDQWTNIYPDATSKHTGYASRIRELGNLHEMPTIPYMNQPWDSTYQAIDMILHTNLPRNLRTALDQFQRAARFEPFVYHGFSDKRFLEKAYTLQRLLKNVRRDDLVALRETLELSIQRDGRKLEEQP